MTVSKPSESNSTSPVIYPRDEHTISRQQIDPDALKILYRLLRHGHKAYLVGGGVRDLLLGKKPKDFDIGTDATPRKIKEIFRNSRIIGRRFKLVHVYFHGNKIIEVSTFRDSSDIVEEDVDELAEQKPSAKISPRDNRYGDEQTDALRRDITINGLFYDVSSFSVIDYVGGMDDLRSGVIRVIGNPDARFKEDPVRMLRVIRHAIRSNFVIEESCWRSLVRNRELICEVTPVRVYDEIKKDLCSGHSLEILRLLDEAKLLELLLPELAEGRPNLLSDLSGFSQALNRADSLVLKGESISPTTILALMALFIGEASSSVDRIVDRFQAREALHEHVYQCFTDLAVPKKEKERIEKILVEFLHLYKTPIEKRKLGASGKRASLEDLYNIWRILFPAEAKELFAQIARGALDKTGAAGTREKRHNDSRRRGTKQRKKPSPRRFF